MFALHHIHLGDELDAAGNPDWYRYGYDIDGLDTTATSTDVCTPYQNASRTNQVDGPGGIDNSFGKNIVATLLDGIVENPSQTTDGTLTQGQYTILFDITGLTAGGGQNATGLTGMLFAGAPFNEPPNAATALPTWTLGDVWPLDPSFVTSAITGTTLGQPVTSSEAFSGAYITNGVFVSGQPTNVTLTIPIEGARLTLPIQHAVITFNHPGDTGAGGAADANLSGGIISGVIDANQLVTNLQAVAGSLSQSFCNASNFAAVARAILQAADILNDGDNGLGIPCNGISVGIGFDADEVAPPQFAGAPVAQASPCGGGG